jgi:hypothetical protein
MNSVTVLMTSHNTEGKVVGTQQVPAYASQVTFSVPYAPGKLTALALDGSGKVVDQHSVATTGTVAAIQFSIDAPSADTGTGDALVADGEDVVRCALFDKRLHTRSTIEFHPFVPLETSRSATNGIPLGCPISYRWHCTLRPTTEGHAAGHVGRLDRSDGTVLVFEQKFAAPPAVGIHDVAWN